MAREPATEAIKPWEKHPLCDVGLVELVADFPLYLSGNDDPACDIGVMGQVIIEGDIWP